VDTAGGFELYVRAQNGNDPTDFQDKRVTVWVQMVTVGVSADKSTVILGEDLLITYTVEVEQSGQKFDSVDVKIKNSSGTVVAQWLGQSGTEGSHNVTWQGAKWNTGAHNGAYANPNSNDYTIEAIGHKGSDEKQATASVATHFRISALLKDEPVATGEIATGLDSPSSNVRVTIDGPDASFNGQEFTPAFSNTVQKDLLLDGSANDIAEITVTFESSELDSADSGVYTIRVVHGYDVAGNVAGDDRDPSNPEWTVEIR